MQFEFDPKTGMLCFFLAEHPGRCTLKGIPWVGYRTGNGDSRRVKFAQGAISIHQGTFSDLHGTGNQLSIQSPPDEHGITMTCVLKEYGHQPFILFQLAVHNRSREPVFLDEFTLLQAGPSIGGLVSLPEPLGELRFLKVGWHGWDFTGLCRQNDRSARTWLDALTSTSYANPVTSRSRVKGEFWSEGWGILADESSALVAGFASATHQFGQLYARLVQGQVSIKLSSQGDGVILEPGESCESEWGYLQLVHLPNPEPSLEFVRTVARQMYARVPSSPPPAMWTHWYHFYHHISEDLFLQAADTIAIHRNAIPVQVIELDDGYQADWGDWTETNDRFPHGLEWLADQVRGKGFSPGLWLAPFQVQARSKVASQHPDWLLKDQNGKSVHAGFQYNKFLQALDGTHPAVLDHFRILADKICRQWGYQMLKLDFLNSGALPGRRYNPKLTRLEALRHGLQALRDGAGDDTFLLGSGCPFAPAIGIVDAMRISPDTAPSWEPYIHWIRWAGPLIKKEFSMPSLRNALRHTLNLSVIHKQWWWNDPDCLLTSDTDTRLTEAEVRSAITLIGLSGGMLVLSDDLRKVSPERLSWVSLLLPNLGLKGFPSPLLDELMPGCYRVKMQLSGKSYDLFAVFNWTDRTAERHLKFEDIGIPVDTRLHVFDFWSKKYWRINNINMVFPGLPPHGCKLLRVCEVAETPQLVGDTLHISQGAEVATWKLEAGQLYIEIVNMGRYVHGELWLALDKYPMEVTCNGEQVEVMDKGKGIFVLRLEFTGIARVAVSL